MPISSRRRIALGVGVAAICVVAVVAIVLFRQRHRLESAAVYDAWYAETRDGPVIVVELQTWKGPVRNDDVRRDIDAETTVELFSHRLSDGALLGRFESTDFAVPGGWRDRLWVCDKRGNPRLLSAETLQPVADRAAIGRPVGGDFETGNRCFVDQFTGRLAVKGADGKRHWVGTDLRAVPLESDTVTPQGWFCNPGPGHALIEPRIVECLSPQSAPASSLALSKSSALAKDAGQTELLSGISASYGADTKVLWTKSLAQLAGTAEAPFWLGARTLDPHRVAIMVRTAGTHVHVIVLDPTTGAVHDTKVLFQHVLPGAAP